MAIVSYKGDKCILRPLEASDKTFTKVWRNNPSIRDMVMGFRFPVTDEMEDIWFENALSGQNKEWLIYTMVDNQDLSVIGLIQLKPIDWIARTAFLGIVIGNEAKHHKGFGSEAWALLKTHAFDVMNLRKICIEVADYNQEALAFYLKHGFVEEGVWQKQLFLNGSYHDLRLLACYN